MLGWFGVAATALGLLVLLIACANVTNLLVAQTLDRRHEFGVRLATGASRGRLVRLVIVETLPLTTVALAIGLVFGMGLSEGLASTNLPPIDGNTIRVNPTLDWRVVAFGAALAVVAMLIVSVGPAWRAGKSDSSALTNHAGMIGHGSSRIRSTLVAAQILGSTALVIVSGLFVRSAIATLMHDPGFNVTRTAI